MFNKEGKKHCAITLTKCGGCHDQNKKKKKRGRVHLVNDANNNAMAEKAPENEANYEPPTQRDYDGAPGCEDLHRGNKNVKLHDILSK